MEAEAEPEVEEGEEPGWKPLFRRRVEMAHDHCLKLRRLLRGLVETFHWQERPAEVAGAAAGEALRKLENAATELGLAVASMGAARNIAFWCGAPFPGKPLTSTDGLAEPDTRRALGLLQAAVDITNRVHDVVESARGHLGASRTLLALEDEGHRGGAPWAPGPSKAEHLNGVIDLREALSLAADLYNLVDRARDAAFGFVET